MELAGASKILASGELGAEAIGAIGKLLLVCKMAAKMA